MATNNTIKKAHGPLKLNNRIYHVVRENEQFERGVMLLFRELALNNRLAGFIDVLSKSAFVYGYKGGTKKQQNDVPTDFNRESRKLILTILSGLGEINDVLQMYNWTGRLPKLREHHVWKIYHLIETNLYQASETIFSNIGELICIEIFYRHVSEGTNPRYEFYTIRNLLNVWHILDDLFDYLHDSFEAEEEANKAKPEVAQNSCTDRIAKISKLSPGIYAIVLQDNTPKIFDLIEFDEATKELIGTEGPDWKIKRLPVIEIKDIFKACQVSEQQRA